MQNVYVKKEWDDGRESGVQSNAGLTGRRTRCICRDVLPLTSVVEDERTGPASLLLPLPLPLMRDVSNGVTKIPNKAAWLLPAQEICARCSWGQMTSTVIMK